MPSSRSPSSTAGEAYWVERLGSKAFRRGLTALFVDELRLLATMRIGDLIDANLVRRTIRDWDRHSLDSDAVAAVAIQLQRRIFRRLDRQRRAPRTLTGEAIAAHIEALLTQPAQPSKEMEAALNRLVQQEFVTNLLTDLVFTSIAAFYQRLNPLFGAFAMRTLEDQIKTFIRRFMPMLQERVTAFALSRDNQQAAHELSRVIAKQILTQPLSDFAAMVSPVQRHQLEGILREALRSVEIDHVARQLASALFDDAYAILTNQKLGELLHLERHAHKLAKSMAEALLPILHHAPVLRFVAREMDEARPAVEAPRTQRRSRSR